MAVRHVFALLVGSLLLSTIAQARDVKRWKNDYGVEISLYPRPGTRMLRVSFQTHHPIQDAERDHSIKDALKAVAEVARDQGSGTFAITNIYCSSMLSRAVSDGCAIEGAWLKAGERVVTQPKDNKPVYFSTAAALEQRIASGWIGSIDTSDGLTGKVDIVTADSTSPPIAVLGAEPQR